MLYQYASTWLVQALSTETFVSIIMDILNDKEWYIDNWYLIVNTGHFGLLSANTRKKSTFDVT